MECIVRAGLVLVLALASGSTVHAAAAPPPDIDPQDEAGAIQRKVEADAVAATPEEEVDEPRFQGRRRYSGWAVGGAHLGILVGGGIAAAVETTDPDEHGAWILPALLPLALGLALRRLSERHDWSLKAGSTLAGLGPGLVAGALVATAFAETPMGRSVRPMLYGTLMTAFTAVSMILYNRLRGGAGWVTGIFYGLVLMAGMAGAHAARQGHGDTGAIVGTAVGAGLGLGFAALAPLLRW